MSNSFQPLVMVEISVNDVSIVSISRFIVSNTSVTDRTDSLFMKRLISFLLDHANQVSLVHSVLDFDKINNGIEKITGG